MCGHFIIWGCDKNNSRGYKIVDFITDNNICLLNDGSYTYLHPNIRMDIDFMVESDSYGCCCCLPTPMALAGGGSPMFPLVVHQPASPSIWPAVQSLRRGLSTNPGATMWCVCGCS